jgi:hypothetical protein
VLAGRLSRRGSIATSTIAAAALAVAPAAFADFTVNDTGDTAQGAANGTCDADNDPNNGLQCTLREAVTEANGAAGLDTITFSGAFTGVSASSTIDVGSSITPNNTPVAIDGGDCDPSPSAAKPCVGVNTTANSTPLTILTADSSVHGIAFSMGGAFNVTLLNLFGANGIVRNSWFGLRLDQTVTGCGFGSGVQVQGNGGTVGGSAVADRNVFAGCSTGVNLRSDNNTVAGNRFGTLPNGTTATGTAENVGIALNGFTGDPASENTIGGADPATPSVCDGPCNLIANNTLRGVNAGPSATGAADGTMVQGNFIGVGPSGTGGSNVVGVVIDNGDGNVVGGPAPADRNYFQSNAFALNTGSAPINTVVQNNYFGVDPAGDAAPSPDTNGPQLTDVDGSSVLDNRFAEPLTISGGAATVQGNSFGIGSQGEDIGFSGAAISLTTVGSNSIGGTAAGDANELGNVSRGIDITNSNGNTIRGNSIGADLGGGPQPVPGAGILMSGNDDGNAIGGDTAASENVIVSTADDAVTITDNTSDGNTVARNTGSAGSGTFLDLGADGPGNTTGVNENQQALTVTSLTPTTMSGPGTLTGRVRVFQARELSDGDLARLITDPSFAGEPFSVAFSPPLTQGTCVTASYTNANGSTSEFSDPAVVDAADCDTTPPTASISSGPSGLTNDATPTFGLSSNEAGSSFQCRVDAAAFAPCTTPHTTAALGQGAHTFEVMAIDGVGNVGAPASRAFSVDSIPPNTGAISGKKKSRRRRVTFRFPTAAATTYTCKVDKRPAVSCTSPYRTPRLKPGKHLLRVAAHDAAGNVDPTPSRRRFRVLRRR